MLFVYPFMAGETVTAFVLREFVTHIGSFVCISNLIQVLLSPEARRLPTFQKGGFSQPKVCFIKKRILSMMRVFIKQFKYLQHLEPFAVNANSFPALR